MRVRCSHCKGTGYGTEKAVLECVGCQCKVTITYEDTSELIEKAANVLCADCRKRDK